MNCTPGDLAIVVGNSMFTGQLVEVLYAAPQTDFCLPDGYWHMGCTPGTWVIRSLGSPFSAPTEERGCMRVATYGAGADARLRPLRGELEIVETINGLEILA